MDLSVIESSQQDLRGEEEQQQLTNECRHHIFKSKETFKETDFEGNNNFSNDSKTEVTNNHGHDASSLIHDEMCDGEIKFELIHKISTCKRAMDLSIHNRTSDGGERTIFDDAEYFSRNYSYKLLPINFENVNETIIHMEHNYCHLSLSSGSDAEVDCSRTMDYNQVKERNYKKRRERFKEIVADDELECKENANDSLAREYLQHNKMELSDFHLSEEEKCSLSGKPLDLSAPSVEDKKTDNYLKEYPTSIVVDYKDDSAQFDSDKENQKSNVNFVEVTIARTDGKENYQPCDLFLSDIANLVPKLIQKDCCGIDILDCTCDSYLDFHKHRLYYVISQSTWRLFQSASERVILTNDKSLGQPVQKLEEDEKPTYLVFDQYSLAKSLAEYCNEIGGCFEYTFVEESKDDSTGKLSKIHLENEKPKNKLEKPLECDLELTKVEEFSEESKNCQISSVKKNTVDKKIEPESKCLMNGGIETDEKTKESSLIEGDLSTVNLEKVSKNCQSDVISETVENKWNSKRDDNSKDTILKEESENSIAKKNSKTNKESNRKVVEKSSSPAEIKSSVQTIKGKKEEKVEKPATRRLEESSETISGRTRLQKSNLESSEIEKRNLRKFKKWKEEEKEKRNINNNSNSNNNNDSYMRTRSKSTSDSEVAEKVERHKPITSQIGDIQKESAGRRTKCRLSLSENLEKTIEKRKTKKRKMLSAEISSILEIQSKRKIVSKKENNLVKCNKKKKSVETRRVMKEEKKINNFNASAKENLPNRKSKSNNVLTIKKKSANTKMTERKSVSRRTKMATRQNNSRSEKSRVMSSKNNRNSKRREMVERKKDNNKKVLSKGRRKR